MNQENIDKNFKNSVLGQAFLKSLSQRFEKFSKSERVECAELILSNVRRIKRNIDSFSGDFSELVQEKGLCHNFNFNFEICKCMIPEWDEYARSVCFPVPSMSEITTNPCDMYLNVNALNGSMYTGAYGEARCRLFYWIKDNISDFITALEIIAEVKE